MARLVEEAQVVQVAQQVGHLPPVERRPGIASLVSLVDHPGSVVPEIADQLVPALAGHGDGDLGAERAPVTPDRVAAAAPLLPEDLAAAKGVALRRRLVAGGCACRGRYEQERGG